MENEDSIGQTLDIWGIGKRIVQIMVLNNRTMNCMGFPTHHAIYDRHSIHEIFRQFDGAYHDANPSQNPLSRSFNTTTISIKGITRHGLKSYAISRDHYFPIPR